MFHSSHLLRFFFDVKKILLKLIILLASTIILAPSHATAWPWGPQNYDECVLEEMKGRTKDQESLVRPVCLERFPRIPGFTVIEHEGTLKCLIEDVPGIMKLQIQNNKATISGLQDFKITSRTKRDIRGILTLNSEPDSPPDSVKNTELYLDFHSGFGHIKPIPTGSSTTIFFNCQDSTID